MKRLLLVLFGFGIVSLGASACSNESESSPSSDAEQACVDTADAVAKAAERCGQNYDANRTAFINAAANGDCSNIAAVRDKDALYGTCIPSLATISCPDLMAANLDPSCKAQLLQQ